MDKIQSTVLRMANEPVWSELDKLKADKAALLPLLARAESFIAGFEDDETQAGVPALLRDLRTAIAGQPARGVNVEMLTALKLMRDLHAPAEAKFPSPAGSRMRVAFEAAEAAIASTEAQCGQVADAPARQGGTPVIPVDALEWQEIGEEHQPKARLLAALQIGDCMFHVEAREIDPKADPQSTLEYGGDLDKFGDIADQGDFATMTREGREYFVFILPYEA